MSAPDVISAYLSRIGGEPVPSAIEERELARRARLGRDADDRLTTGVGRPGDMAATEDGRCAHAELFSRNLKLVVAVAKRYPTSATVELADLIQEGNIALDHAISKYDERRGHKFSTYAVNWIQQATSRALDKHSTTAKVPVETARRVRAALRHNGGDAAALPPDLREAEFACCGASLDAPIDLDDGRGLSLGERLTGPADTSFEDSIVEALDRRIAIDQVLAGVDSTTRKALVRRFGLDGSRPASIAVIARELGVGPKAVKRLLAAVLVD